MIADLKVEISVAWWVRWYVRALVAVACLSKRGPDMDKIHSRIMRGIRTRVIAVPRG